MGAADPAGRRPPNLRRALSAPGVLQGGGPVPPPPASPSSARRRVRGRGSDRGSALGGHRLASQVGNPRAMGSDPGVRDCYAPRPRPARRGLGSAAWGRGSFRAPPAGGAGWGGGSGERESKGVWAEGRWARGSRARRARRPCCCGPRFGGREGGGFVFREMPSIKEFFINGRKGVVEGGVWVFLGNGSFGKLSLSFRSLPIFITENWVLMMMMICAIKGKNKKNSAILEF